MESQPINQYNSFTPPGGFLLTTAEPTGERQKNSSDKENQKETKDYLDLSPAARRFLELLQSKRQGQVKQQTN
jgi:hypothetical protein